MSADKSPFNGTKTAAGVMEKDHHSSQPPDRQPHFDQYVSDPATARAALTIETCRKMGTVSGPKLPTSKEFLKLEPDLYQSREK